MSKQSWHKYSRKLEPGIAVKAREVVRLKQESKVTGMIWSTDFLLPVLVLS